MAADPLRSLYLAVGVRGDAQAVGALSRVRIESDRLYASFLRTARAGKELDFALGMRRTGAGPSPIQQSAVAMGQMARNTDAYARSVDNVGRTARRAGFAGGVGLGTSLFVGYQLLGAARFGLSAGANAEQAAIRGSMATGGAMSQRQALAASLAISRRRGVRTGVSDAAVQAVANLGIDDPAAIQALALSATMLQQGTGEVEAAAAAQSIHRLIRQTRGQGTQTERLRNSQALFDMLVFAGQRSSANIPAVASMLQEIQSTGLYSGMSDREMIAIAGAFADIDPNAREAVRGSLTRFFTGQYDTKLSMIPGFAQAQGIEKLRLLEAHMRPMDLEQRKQFVGNFANVRDVAFVTKWANGVDKFNEIMTGKSEGSLNKLADAIQNSLGGHWTEFLSSLERLGVGITQVLGPVLKGILQVLTSTANAVGGNPVLAGAAGLGLGYLGVRTVGRMFGRLLGRGGGGMIGGSLLGSFLGGGVGEVVSSSAEKTALKRGLLGVGEYVAFQTFGGLGSKVAGKQALRSAGLLRLLGGRAGGRFAGGLLTSAGGRAALAGIPIAGQVALAASMLEDPLRSGGASLNAWGATHSGIGGSTALLAGGSLHFLGSIGGAVNGTLNAIGGLFARLVMGSDKTAAAAEKLANSAGGGSTININVGNSPQASFQVAMDQAARRAAYYIPSASYAGV